MILTLAIWGEKQNKTKKENNQNLFKKEQNVINYSSALGYCVIKAG